MPATTLSTAAHPKLDAKVEQFLESNRHRWNAWNVPFEDGKILYGLYFKDLDTKVAVGGCFTAHNTLRIYAQEVKDFLVYVKSKPNYRTRIEQGSGEGISISCKTAP
ncbi:MAG: hypothetical protein HY766_08375 [candidate division NC10 bacterium]|nr:hypothetical protein [candidate division NC10 bacterium]MBI4840499.1 hypothetical protein [candidate division NC10 bacterium]